MASASMAMYTETNVILLWMLSIEKSSLPYGETYADELLDRLGNDESVPEAAMHAKRFSQEYKAAVPHQEAVIV